MAQDKWLPALTGAVAGGLIVALGFSLLKPAAGPTPQASSVPPAPALAIQVVTARQVEVPSELKLTGQVTPTEAGRADITVALQGVVTDVLVKIGDDVRAGQPVAQLDSVYGQTGYQMLQKLETDQSGLVQAQTTLSQSQNSYGQAEATLAQARTTLSQAIDTARQGDAELVRARSELKRKELLLQGGVAAQADVEDAQERYDKAASAASDAHASIGYARRQAAVSEKNLDPLMETIRFARHSVELAQAALDRDRALYRQVGWTGAELPSSLTPVQTGGGADGAGAVKASTAFYVRAPVAGTVTALSISRGQSVSPGTIIVSEVDTHQVYVDANAFESDLPSVRTGDPVSVDTEAAPGTTFHGVVRSVGRQVDPIQRTVVVRTLVSNPGAVLRPSMFVNVDIRSRRTHAVVVVPASALVFEEGKHYVFVQSGGHFDKREVEVGANSQVTAGLSPGSQVATEGSLLLESGP